jgi:hypothetical protein
MRTKTFFFGTISCTLLVLAVSVDANAAVLVAAPISPGGINQPNRTTNGVNLYFWDGTPTGTLNLFTTILPATQNGLYDPAGVAFSPWGELFVSNRQGNQSSNPTTGSISRFLVDGSGNMTPNGTITGNSLWAVHGLAFSSSGELFAANLFSDKISRFTFDISKNAIANGTITAPPGSYLEGLAFSSSGELFASEYNQIGRFTFDANGNATSNGIISNPGTGRLHFINFSSTGELFAPAVDESKIYLFLFSSGNPINNGSFSAQYPAGTSFCPDGELLVTTHWGPPLYNSGGLARFTFDGSGNAVANGTQASDPNNDGLGAIAVQTLSAPVFVWKGGGSPNPINWAESNNWNYNTVPNGSGTMVSFGTQSAANHLVDLISQGQTVGTVAFAAATSTTIQSSGGFNLTLDNNGNASTIDVAGNHAISASVVLNYDASITGTGNLDLSGGVTGPFALSVFGKVTATSIQVKTLVIGNTKAVQTVPEPSALVLLGIGSLGLLTYAWRRRK